MAPAPRPRAAWPNCSAPASAPSSAPWEAGVPAPSRPGCADTGAPCPRGLRWPGRGRRGHVLHRQLCAVDDAGARRARAGALPAAPCPSTTRRGWRSLRAELQQVRGRLEREHLTVRLPTACCRRPPLPRRALCGLRSGSGWPRFEPTVLPDSAARRTVLDSFFGQVVGCPSQRADRAPDRCRGRAHPRRPGRGAGFSARPPGRSAASVPEAPAPALPRPQRPVPPRSCGLSAERTRK